MLTIEKLMHNCGQSLIKPSVVSAPMDFMTTEAEYIRVWQVRACGSHNKPRAVSWSKRSQEQQYSSSIGIALNRKYRVTSKLAGYL